MKCFVAQLTEDKYIAVQADRMELLDNTILAYDGDQLVALVDRGVTISAHISEKSEPAAPGPNRESDHTPKDSTPKPIPQKEPTNEITETGYKGFLYVKCEQCGSARGFCVKTPITENRCSCGHTTTLRSMKPLFLTCKCGESFKYLTNLTDRMATISCIKCGSPVDLELHEKKGVYETIEG